MLTGQRGEPRGELMALLADVKENPREDGLRLILADWLEESSHPLDPPRAELIRAQIDMDRLSSADPARSEAGRQARDLQQRHGKAWLGPLVDRLIGWHFERGLLSVAAALSALRTQSMLALAETESWAWVEEVVLSGCDDADLVRLTGSGLMTQLVSLGFRNSQVGPAGAQALGKLPWLARIEQLNLSSQAIGDRGLAVLLESAFLGRLRGLTLAGCKLTREACRHLVRAALPIERLTLWGNSLGDQGATILCEASLPSLRRLDLRITGLGDEGARRIAESPHLAGLRALDLSDNRIGPAGAMALATSTTLHSVESLVLWGNPVGVEAASHLQARFGARVHVSPVPG